MGAGMSIEQQEDLGIVAQAALRQSMGKELPRNNVLICSALAKLVPLLAESDIRMLIYEIETALSRFGPVQHELVELLTVLRRLDRP